MMFMCFNTSHVVVYQDVRGQDVNNPLSFNTSHVVVYQQISLLSSCYTNVSIHLML